MGNLHIVKTTIKTIVGVERLSMIRSSIEYARSIPSIIRPSSRMVLSKSVSGCKLLSQSGYHIFCGYFDIVPDCAIYRDEVLVHRLSKSASFSRDSIDLCIANCITGEIQQIAQSRAWCWQMGSRLRWGLNRDEVLFNDFDEDYCNKVVNIRTGQCVKRYNHAFYDIAYKSGIGASLDFSRLGRLRPGYGYGNMRDKSIGELYPDHNGLDIVSLESDSLLRRISLAELASLVDCEIDGETYINHVSLSPNGKKAMFFFIWKTNEKPGWKATLWVFDIELNDLVCLESKDQVSHYAWLDDDRLLITGIDNDRQTGFYRIYNCKGGYSQLNAQELSRDGHPSPSRTFDGFYSDTYPDKNNRQLFYRYEYGGDFELLAKLYHDPRMNGEKRCDLHPHYCRYSNRVLLDTTCKFGRRSVLVLDMNEN